MLNMNTAHAHFNISAGEIGVIFYSLLASVRRLGYSRSSGLAMHLSSASPKGETPGWCGGIRGLNGDFATNFCPYGGGNVGTLIFECPTLGKNVGTSLLFNWEEIRKYRLFARSMARWWRRRRRYLFKSIVFCLSNRPSKRPSKICTYL